MIVTGARGTYAQFGQQIASEFQGQNNFTYWLLAIVAVGSLGYVSALQTLSRYLLALVILSLFLSHKGFFAQFSAALKTGPTPPNPVGSSASGPTNAVGVPGGPTLKQSLQQPGGGGFWNYFGIPSPFGATQ